MREPQLYEKRHVDALGDPNLWRRIQNKVIGGKSADDGWKMEHFYALHKLIEIGAEVVLDTSRINDINDDADVTQYAPCLVDDLRVRNSGKTTFYQLKSGRVPLDEVLKDVDRQSKLDPTGQSISYVAVVTTKRRAVLLENRAKRQGNPLKAEVFAFSRNWRIFADMNPTLVLSMMRLSGHDNDNRHQALFTVLSGLWLERDDVYVRDFIFSAWQYYRMLFIDRDFPPITSFVDPDVRGFETALRKLGFSVGIAPELYVGCGSNFQWSPIVPCGKDFFTVFMTWFKAAPRSNADIMYRLWSHK
ncbi:hypothetical protein H4S14_004198 [Agrobacterium vitis]|nr:hypothetical protein [Agrobacterium vitis]MBE1440424.1 hypothetical protein [Agrobacterium vitis]